MLPNFFIVGAPKAGTSSLYNYLRQHPEIYMSPVKEPHFFSSSYIVRQNLYYKSKLVDNIDDYQKLFSEAIDQKAVGEASTSYLFYPEVPGKIKEMRPDALIIIMLRNPIDRCFSHYLMDYRLGLIKAPLQDVISGKIQQTIGSLYYQQYIDLGLYYQQVKRYYDVFGRNAVKVILFDDFTKQTIRIVQEIYCFLKVDKSFSPDLKKSYNAYKLPKHRLIDVAYRSTLLRKLGKMLLTGRFLTILEKKLFTNEKPELNNNLTIELLSIFYKDIKKLEILLDRELSVWYE